MIEIIIQDLQLPLLCLYEQYINELLLENLKDKEFS